MSFLMTTENMASGVAQHAHVSRTISVLVSTCWGLTYGLDTFAARPFRHSADSFHFDLFSTTSRCAVLLLVLSPSIGSCDHRSDSPIYQVGGVDLDRSAQEYVAHSKSCNQGHVKLGRFSYSAFRLSQ